MVKILYRHKVILLIFYNKHGPPFVLTSLFGIQPDLIIRIPRCSASEVLEESLKTDSFHKMIKLSSVEYLDGSASRIIYLCNFVPLIFRFYLKLALISFCTFLVKWIYYYIPIWYTNTIDMVSVLVECRGRKVHNLSIQDQPHIIVHLG